jgi:hypothetical protein
MHLFEDVARREIQSPFRRRFQSGLIRSRSREWYRRPNPNGVAPQASFFGFSSALAPSSHSPRMRVTAGIICRAERLVGQFGLQDIDGRGADLAVAHMDAGNAIEIFLC